MSPRRSTGGESSSARTALAVVAVAVIAVALVFIVRARPQTEPFDPRSSSPSGARGLVLLLEDFGATVDVTDVAPEIGSDARVLVLDDRLDSEQRTALLDFVEGGGLAVVADPTSSLHGGPGPEGGSLEIDADGTYDGADLRMFLATVDRGRCTIGALEHLRGLAVETGLSYPIAPSDPACFGDERHAFVLARSLGEGTVVGLGDNEVFTNRLLGQADNSGLATALLAPTEGARVTIVLGNGPRPAGAPEVGAGDDTLVDLVHPSVWMMIAMLAVAFVLFAVGRGIRPGRVVDEPVLAPIAGSELVAATGNVMHRAGHLDRAALLMRRNAHRVWCSALGVSPLAPLEVLDDAACRRWGTAPGEVVELLGGAVPTSERALVQLATRLAALGAHLPEQSTDHRVTPVQPQEVR
jgi:hypothetical protein